MNVLLFSDVGVGEGGVETVFDRVANGLRDEGHTVTQVYKNNALKAGRYANRIGQRELGLFCPPTWKSTFRPSFARRLVVSSMGLYRLLSDLRPDVVNYHYFEAPAVHFALLKPLFGYRLVLSLHGSDTADIHHMKRKIAPFIVRQCDCVTAVSRALGDRFREEVPGDYEVRVIHNGIDDCFWRQSPQDLDSSETAPKIVSVGSLRNVKGHDILIRAFQNVLAESPEAHLRIIGDGPQRTSYKALIQRLGIDDQVQITGWLSAEEIRREFRKASVFVFPSRWEGFGIALVEAMASGLPVVASRVGGIPEIVDEKTSVLVPPESPSALSEAILRVLDADEWRRRAAQAAVRRASQFTWRQTTAEYADALGASSHT